MKQQLREQELKASFTSASTKKSLIFSDTRAHILVLLCLFSLLLYCPTSTAALEEEKTYDISLVKTAQVDKELRKVGDKKVLTETCVVKKGDWVWKLLREKGLLEKGNLAEVLAVLKKLNKSLENLDLIRPGEKIIIPLKIAPASGTSAGDIPLSEEIHDLSALEDIDFEKYTVKKGDSIINVVKGRYQIPPEELYKKYLDIVRRLNPTIDDIDRIYPGQVVRLPVYTAEVVRKPLKAMKKVRGREKDAISEIEGATTPLARGLAYVFLQMGEEWIQTGRHFIPLRAGGQVDLDAETCPMISLSNGKRIIVDLENALPEKMGRLIEASWSNYRVVRVSGDDLPSAFDKILDACDYPEVSGKDEPFELDGAIPFEIKGDRVITLAQGERGRVRQIAVLNFEDARHVGVPWPIAEYLRKRGVKIIDYPPTNDTFDYKKPQTLEAGSDAQKSLETVLKLTGHDFTSPAQLNPYKEEKGRFNMTVKADFLLKIKGKDSIIDVTGLPPESVSLLKEQEFRYLGLAEEHDPVERIAKTFLFMDMEFEPGPISFTAAGGQGSANIRFKVPGLTFSDKKGNSILATSLEINKQVASFLSTKGYRILIL